MRVIYILSVPFLSVSLLLWSHTALGQDDVLPQSEEENTASKCGDTEDNDLDGKTDCDDEDCGLFTFCAPESKAPAVVLVDRDPGRGLVIAGAVVAAIGLASGAASLGLATQSTSDDAFLFSSIGTGGIGWAMSVAGGGLLLGGQVRGWRAVRNSGGERSTGLAVSSGVLYGLLVVGGAALAAMGPTVGPATGVGSAPFFGPMLVLEVAAYCVLLPAGIVSSRRARSAVEATAAVELVPYGGTTALGDGGVFGVAGNF